MDAGSFGCAAPRRRPVAVLASWGLAGALLVAACASPGPSGPERFGAGTPATAEQIAALDVDVMPDGTGLPALRATARDGVAPYASRCARCHGATGREGPLDRLADEPAATAAHGADPGARRTVGNYWPYATTLFDYVRRAMPPENPGSLADAEVLALTAYVLYLNGLVALDDPLDAQALSALVMPARGRFVPDDRRGGTEIR